MTSITPQACIQSLELFSECTRGQRDLVARLTTVTDVPKGTPLCRHGEVGTSFFVVARGTVAVTLDGAPLATLDEGCGFGEVALLRSDGRRVADVTASTDATLLVFSRPEFATLMAEVPSFARIVLAMSRDRLGEQHGGGGLVATS